MFQKPSDQAATQAYSCHCHCGTVQYKVKLSPPLYPSETDPTGERWRVIRCNCSICRRNGYLLVHPFIHDVEFTKGQDKLGEYFFGSKTKPHWFCKECGSSLGIDISSMGELGGGQRYALSVRMFNDVDVDTLEYRDVNGRDMIQPAYQPKVQPSST